MGKQYNKTSPKFFENIREINGVKEKRCVDCQEWFPETTEYFYMRNKSKPEKGFQAACKKCTIKKTREYTVNHIEAMYKYKEDWRKQNIILSLSHMRNYYQNNKEQRKAYIQDWHDKNPEKQKEYQNNHRKHDITNTEWISCKEYFNNECAYCGLLLSEHYYTRRGITKLGDFHKEHAYYDGANDLSNCVPACRSCNSTKNLKTLDVLLESKFIERFSQNKYNKIRQWLEKDHKQYIEPKLPYIITRKQKKDKRTYYYELWTVDDKRNMVECIATADKKKGLKEYIHKYFPEES